VNKDCDDDDDDDEGEDGCDNDNDDESDDYKPKKKNTRKRNNRTKEVAEKIVEKKQNPIEIIKKALQEDNLGDSIVEEKTEKEEKDERSFIPIEQLINNDSFNLSEEE
jgi:hypothetical protein